MVRGQTANTRLTVDLGSAALYRGVKVAAAYKGKALRDVVVEALRDWLEKQEELEDLADYMAAEGEPERPLEEFLAELDE
jgi:hypothetical protein